MNSRLLKEIREIQKQISLLEDYVTVADSGLSYISTDNDATKTDEIRRSLLQDINTAAREAGVRAKITTAKSGHSTRTIHGTISRHSNNDAVDISIINNESAEGASSTKEGNPEFKRLGDKLKNELVKLGYVWNRPESGNDKVVLWQTNQGGNHYNHLHVSNVTDSSSDATSDDSSDEEDNTDGYKQPKTKTDLGRLFRAFQKFV